MYRSLILVVFTLASCLNGVPLLRDDYAVDPEVQMNISQIIQYNGYPCENHHPITTDGYIISMQRIPRGRQNNFNGPRPAVLLQHGLLDSSHTWANNLPNQSLAFVLADQGFDVWMCNSRGNTYSDRNVNETKKSKTFWKFSWDDMAQYDVPACVDRVLKVTGQKKLSYVGHSQGTLIAFASLPNNAKLRSQISSVVALGPVAYVGHVEAGLHFLAQFRRELELFLELFGHGQFLTNTFIMKDLAKTLCARRGIPRLCSDVIFMLAGYDVKNLNETRLPVYIAHTPAGTSLMNVIHFAQSVTTNQFQKYDYGSKENMKHYGQKTPPLYSLTNYSSPTMFVSGGKDVLADPTDVTRLAGNLGKTNLLKHLTLPDYNHLDFVWGKDAAVRVYPEVIAFIKQHM